ncbi:MAG: hypothetical protein GC178_08610 [Flavobacteriales bacterium]|nr:hypothetical protein [Flavobacteriales bacterium]
MISERTKKRGLFERLMLVINVFVLIGLLLSYLAGIISPAKFWPLAFVGMAYPVLLIATVFFTVYWMLNRKWMLFLNITFLLLKWDYVQETVQFRTSPPASSENGMKVMSFNVRLFDRFDWLKDRNTKKSIYQFLFDEKPNILCIQEFFFDHRKGATPVDTLLNVSTLNYMHVEKNRAPAKWKSFVALATFSEYPIVQKGVVFFDMEHNNMGMFTDVDVEGDTIRIYNVHLQSIGLQDKDYALLDQLIEERVVQDSKEGKQFIQQMVGGFKKRADQADKVAEHVRNSPYPVIVCGDFNDVPTSYAYQTIRKGLEDTYTESGSGIGATYVRLPLFRIDNILHSEDLIATEHIVHPQVMSDHLAISSNLTFRTK